MLYVILYLLVGAWAGVREVNSGRIVPGDSWYLFLYVFLTILLWPVDAIIWLNSIRLW